METFILGDLSDASLDAVLGLTVTQKVQYFSKLIKQFFPKVSEESEQFKNLLAAYASSYYLEKLYRSNAFFSENYTIVYTNSGLIRNAVSDLYFTDDSIITH